MIELRIAGEFPGEFEAKLAAVAEVFGYRRLPQPPAEHTGSGETVPDAGPSSADAPPATGKRRGRPPKAAAVVEGTATLVEEKITGPAPAEDIFPKSDEVGGEDLAFLEVEAPKVEVTLEMCRNQVRKLLTATDPDDKASMEVKTARAKKLLAEFNVDKVGALKVEQLADFMLRSQAYIEGTA